MDFFLSILSFGVHTGETVLQVLKEAKQATESTLELGNQFHPTLPALHMYKGTFVLLGSSG